MQDDGSAGNAIGFSADEVRALVQRVTEIAASAGIDCEQAMRDAVRDYLIAEPQRAAREHVQEQEAPLKRIVEFEREWLEDVANDPDRPSDTDLEHLKRLLGRARGEPVAYEAAKAISRSMVVAGKKPDLLKDFVSDDWAGLIKPASRTRRKKPQDWHRQEQIAACVYALVAAGYSQRKAINTVVCAARSARIVWAKTYATEAVTFENVRGAWRASNRFQRLYRRLD